MKKSLISSHFAHHRPRDKLVTYYLNCEGGQIKMPKEALDDYMARYCANSTAWRSCTIARALLLVNEEYRPVLKAAGLLTRDPRMKERKKYGLKAARRAPQFSKR